MRLKQSTAAFLLLVAAGVPGAHGQAISSFSPLLGSAGEQVIINGSGFYPGTLVVRFNGVQDQTAMATSASLIYARVPAGAPLGAAPISVKVGSASPVLSVADFQVIGPGPYVTNFTPAIGNAGTPVIIGGVHFTNPVTVTFNGVPGVGATATSYKQISVTAPNGVTTGPITVTTSTGTHTTATNFHVPPAISGFTPATGRAGTNVVLTGANLADASAVRFGGTHAMFNVISNGAILAIVPTNAPTGQIRVDAPAGAAISSGNFIVQPSIHGFTPTSGPVGASVTVTGANFTAANLRVYFNGVPAATPTGVTFGQLTATVPSTTTGPITVTTADGSATSVQNFHLSARITGFTPAYGAPGTRVTLTGVNFSNTTAVTFNDAPAAFTVTNNTTLGATVPPGVTTGPITLTTPAGNTNSGTLLFYALPVIDSFTPMIGRPGTNVTLTGTNFLGATAVRFNGTNAPFTVVNNGQITTVVPTNALSGPISVVAPAGTNFSAGSFTVDYQADLGVTIMDTPDPVFLGGNLVYTVIVTNRGPFAALATVLSNTLPAGVLLQTATTTHGSVNTDANPVIASMGALNAGASATLTLTVTPQEAGWITNLAGVASGYPDPSGGDNTAQAATLVLPAPYLSIQRVADNRLRVSWPVELTNFILQFQPDLAATSAWLNATSTVTISGARRGVTETNAAPSRFYRLMQ